MHANKTKLNCHNSGSHAKKSYDLTYYTSKGRKQERKGGERDLRSRCSRTRGLLPLGVILGLEQRRLEINLRCSSRAGKQG